MTLSKYSSSNLKRLLDVTFSVLILIVMIPLVLIIALIIKFSSPGPIFFLQRRVGKNGKVFKIVKFRTMIPGADKLQNKYVGLNESDGPVFKIKNDPRFTKFGKLLSNTGLDELPQFVNVLKGEMSIVGPRPLPVKEARRLSRTQRIRETVKPGVTSNWVVEGSHKLPFKKWMKLDKDYVINASFSNDCLIIIKTAQVSLAGIKKLVQQS